MHIYKKLDVDFARAHCSKEVTEGSERISQQHAYIMSPESRYYTSQSTLDVSPAI